MDPILSDVSSSTARIRAHDVGLAVTGSGLLTIDGCPVTDLVAAYGAPLWVISSATIRHNLRTIGEAFQAASPRTRIVYASKANPAPAILGLVTAGGAMVDVASQGHAALAERAGVPAGRMVVNGNCKSDAYLRWAITEGVAMINVDSLAEAETLRRLWQPGDPEVRVALRIATDLERHRDDPGMFNSELETKFGLGDADALLAAGIVAAAPGLRLVGLHHHLGFTAYDSSYNAELDLTRRRAVVEQLVELAGAIRSAHGQLIEVLNLGGGFRVETDTGYGPGGVRSIPSVDASAGATAAYATRLMARAGLGEPQIWIEPGGYIVSNAGVFVAEVGVVKPATARGERHDWVFLRDTSAYHFVRRLMMDIHHPVLAANRMSDECDVRTRVAGATCAPDEVAPPAMLPPLRRDDLVALLDHGAYCESVSTEYCSFPLPATVLVDGGEAVPIRARRTVADIVNGFVAAQHV